MGGMSFVKEVVVDASKHLIGRLASVIAKQLLNGQHVTVVRCERLEQTGSHIRNKFKFLSFIRKKTNTNPKRGPFHERSPAKVFKRCVRGMLPKKCKRGYCALARLKTFDGCPAPYDKKKKLVVPEALRILRLRPYRRYSNLGKICSQLGWKHGGLIEGLETKRKEAAVADYKERISNRKAAAAKAADSAELTQVNNELAQFGY